MKRMRFLKVLLVSLLILMPAALLAQGLSPIVSTDDLAKMLKDPKRHRHRYPQSRGL